MYNIVTFGGGKGHSQILDGIKHIPGIGITAVTVASDCGGSTGRLRKETGIGGWLGDSGRCTLALSMNGKHLRKGLDFRFPDGPFAGHTVRNIVLLGLWSAHRRNANIALREFGKANMIGPNSSVLPVTQEGIDALYRVKGVDKWLNEGQLDQIPSNILYNAGEHTVQNIRISPRRARAQPCVIRSVGRADLIVATGGDLFTSTLPSVLLPGLKQAFRATKAKIVIVMNLMTKGGETTGYRAENFLHWIEKSMGRKCDLILFNKELPRKIENILIAYKRLEDKVQLSSLELMKDPRLCARSLAAVSKEGHLYHDSRLVEKAFREIIKKFSPIPKK